MGQDGETGREDFVGAKIAVITGDCVLALLRDDIPGLPWPGHWDLPGGGREIGESPESCALRELEEELGLRLDAARIGYRRFYRAPERTWFFGARWPDLDLGRVRFGNEGQGWAAMPVAEFLAHPKAIPHFRDRLAAFWADG
ncbi:MAG: NUDIX domain-containing protein [Rhodobacteraceae bacterium]|nr:NUDIX domain-containing protein [Paracoccaceae bacterium]